MMDYDETSIRVKRGDLEKVYNKSVVSARKERVVEIAIWGFVGTCFLLRPIALAVYSGASSGIGAIPIIVIDNVLQILAGVLIVSFPFLFYPIFDGLPLALLKRRVAEGDLKLGTIQAGGMYT